MRPFRCRYMVVPLWLVLLAPYAVLAEEKNAEEEAPPRIETRKIVVTDSQCGEEGALREEHRAHVLERVADGDRLQFYDPRKGVVYEVAFESREQWIKTLNEFSGRSAFVRGIWDEEKHIVAFKNIYPAEDREDLSVRPKEKREARN